MGHLIVKETFHLNERDMCMFKIFWGRATLNSKTHMGNKNIMNKDCWDGKKGQAVLSWRYWLAIRRKPSPLLGLEEPRIHHKIWQETSLPLGCF